MDFSCLITVLERDLYEYFAYHSCFVFLPLAAFKDLVFFPWCLCFSFFGVFPFSTPFYFDSFCFSPQCFRLFLYKTFIIGLYRFSLYEYLLLVLGNYSCFCSTKYTQALLACFFFFFFFRKVNEVKVLGKILLHQS